MRSFWTLALILMFSNLSSSLTMDKHEATYKIISSTLPNEVIDTV